MTPSINFTTIPAQDNGKVKKSKNSKTITKKGGDKGKLTKNRKRKNNVLRIKCPICLEFLCVDSVSATVCGHVFCTSCMEKALNEKFLCPICRRKLRGTKAFHHLYLDVNNFD